MATAFVIVWLLTSAGGARAAASFSTGGMIAVVGTFISALIAVTVVIVCLFLPRKKSRKKGTPSSPVNETEVGNRSPLESNGRSNPPDRSDDIECGPSVDEDDVRVAPAFQTTALNQRASNKKRTNKVDFAQKLDLEVKTNFVTASDDQRKGQGETSSNRRPVKPSFSYEGRLPLAYTGFDDEETSVTLVSRDPIGLGFNIYGNMTEGIFVREVLSRGPAMESGIISQGDRILSISISTAHMVLEDALTILSYASSYPVTLRISKTPGQETLFSPSGQLSPVRELGTSSTVERLRERRSRRASVNPLYRSQSLDNLADVKAGSDRSISEFRSSVEHLTRRFSEFRSSPDCLRRNKKASTLYRWTLQQNERELERLYRADAMELSRASENLALDGSRLSVCGEPSDASDTAIRGSTSGENSDKIPFVGLGQPIRCTATLTNQDTPNEEVGAFLKDLSNLEDTRITATVASRPTDLHNEVDGFLKYTSNEDTRINIEDVERQVTVTCRDDIEIDNDDSQVVKNDFKTSDVSHASPCLGVSDSDSDIRLNVERSDLKNSDYLLTRNGDVDGEALSSDSKLYALNTETGSSETEIIGYGRSSDLRSSEINSGIEDRRAEQFRNVAVNFDENEKCGADDPGISGLKVLDRVENAEESDRVERIDRKAVTSAVQCSTVVRIEDPPLTVASSSSEMTTIEVIEPSQLQPTDASPSTKGFLKTMKRLFNFGQSKPGDGETSREDEALSKMGKRSKRKNDKSFVASTEKTGGSNSARKINEIVVHAEIVHELSFADATVGKDDNVPEEDFDQAISDFMGTPQIGSVEADKVSFPMDWNRGITTEPSELNSAIAAVGTDGASNAINNPRELKLDICQTSSQRETEIGVAGEVPDSEVTELGENLSEGVGNCSLEHLDQEMFLEKPVDVTINRQSEISCEPNDFSTQEDIASGISAELNFLTETSRKTTEHNSPAETSTNTTELNSPAETLVNATELNFPAETSINTTEFNSPAETLVNATELNFPAETSINTTEFNSPAETLVNPTEFNSPAETWINTTEFNSPAETWINTTELNSPAETSINTTELDSPAETSIKSGRNEIYFRSKNDSSEEIPKPELTQIVASARTNSHSQKQITVISPLLKKFQADRHDTKVIKPILKKISSVSSSENDSYQNTELPKKTPNFPDDQVQQPTKTVSTSSPGQTKEIPDVYKGVTTPDECRIILDDIWREVELEADTQVTFNERTREADYEGLVENKTETVGELHNHVNDWEAEDSETEKDMPWSAHAPPSYANYLEMVKTESGADELSGSVPEPNYALFPESFETESDKEESWGSSPLPNYANYPAEESEVFNRDTTISNCANYPRVTDTEFRTGKSDTKPDYDGFLLDTISDDFAVLGKENQDPATSTVSYCNDETKTPSQVMKSLLEKLQKFGKRDSKDRTDENVASERSNVLSKTYNSQDILIPFGKKEDGRRENYYNKREEIGLSGLSDIDASKPREARSTLKLGEGSINSCYIASENVVQLMKQTERSEVVIMDDACERSRIVLCPRTVLESVHDELNPEQRGTPKGDINNNSCLSG